MSAVAERLLGHMFRIMIPFYRQNRLRLAAGLLSGIAIILGAQAVWRFDWSTFLPDLIVGGFTGLAVGFVLWRVEVASGRRQAIAAVESDWNVIREQLARAVRQGYVYNPSSLRLVGYGVGKIRERIEDKPLQAWNDVLHSSQLDALIEYLNAADEFDFFADEADVALNSASRGIDFLEPDEERHMPQSVIHQTARGFIDLGRDPTGPELGNLDAEALWSMLRNDGVTRAGEAFRREWLFMLGKWLDLSEALNVDVGDVDEPI
ncbi:hypothetical protein [Agromyces sp. Leaf222]|uniref:hypothetical protein n=1 Tax=Agromyces sp. Leaf222 TaxID=1735688 RepID=UPI0006F940CD|nr:hypothetical protein [Agromyces sp. Leaf222]KQM82420.1 hypothetical protein ASE68_03230 [Agromyces sp. Leaf222]